MPTRRPDLTRFRPEAEVLESRALLTGGLAVYSLGQALAAAVVTGTDGNLYVLTSKTVSSGLFNDSVQGSITEVSPGGTILATDPLPDSGQTPEAIVAATDGSIWVEDPHDLDRLATDGTITRFDVRPGDNVQYTPLAAGPDGSVYFIDGGTSYETFTPTGVTPTYTTRPSIGRITADGTVSYVPVTDGDPTDLTVEADGTVAFVDERPDGSVAIDRLGTDGSLVANPLPAGLTNPTDLTVGPDGAVWFLDANGAAFFGGDQVATIGRLDPSGTVSTDPFTTQPYPQSGWITMAHGLVSSPDGDLYFLDNNAVGQVTTAGVITETSISIPYSQAGDTIGPDGNLWFAVDSNPDGEGGLATLSSSSNGGGNNGGGGGDNGGGGGPGSPKGTTAPPTAPAPPPVTPPISIIPGIFFVPTAAPKSTPDPDPDPAPVSIITTRIAPTAAPRSIPAPPTAPRIIPASALATPSVARPGLVGASTAKVESAKAPIASLELARPPAPPTSKVANANASQDAELFLSLEIQPAPTGTTTGADDPLAIGPRPKTRAALTSFVDGVQTAS